MKAINKRTVSVLTIAMLLSLGGWAGLSARDRNTAVGAGVGAVGGALLTNGNPLGTVGGAAVGGVIGNQVGRRR